MQTLRELACGEKKPTVCAECYWASPQDYQHIALRLVRRLDVVWEQAETTVYDRLNECVQMKQEDLTDYVKAALKEHLGESE